MSEIEFVDHSTVTLYQSNADDLTVCRSAWVSQNTEAHEKEADEGRVEGLINFLWKNKHSCYDPQTEVLTSEGWRYFDELNGSETLASLNMETDEMEFVPCERVVSYDYQGDILHWKNAQTDIMVTPNHNMVASKRIHKGYAPYKLIRADALTKCHKLRLGGGTGVSRTGLRVLSLSALRFLGFFIGDGHLENSYTVSFHMRKKRKVDFLYTVCAELGLDINVRKNDVYAVRLAENQPELLEFIEQTYTSDLKQKVIPNDVLVDGSKEQLQQLWEGLKNSDGHERRPGDFRYDTTSATLAGQVQTVLAMIGSAGTVVERVQGTESTLAAWVVVEQKRNAQPRFNNTPTDGPQVKRVSYNGKVWCATNRNGTLYVRRNGKPCWSGNSPFEHGQFTFIVETPIFVAREFLRHRTFSFNEVSGRYTELKPRFYIPAANRPMRQEGKVGGYTFVPDLDLSQNAVQPILEGMSKDAWQEYTALLERGVAKEVARMVLPLNTMTTFWATVNPRNLMHFLDLRTDDQAQFEIREVADLMTNIFAEQMPLTYKAWRANK